MKSNLSGKRRFLAVFALAAGSLALLLCACGENEANSSHVHDYTARSEIITEAKCNQEGLRRDFCECGESVDVKLEKLNHDFKIDEEKSSPASCDQKGLQVEVCSVCGEERPKETDALGHSFGAWETRTEATETSEGEKIRYCEREGCHASETDTIPKLTSSAKMQLSVKLLRSSGEVFPSSGGIRLSVKNSEGKEVAYSYRMSEHFSVDEGEYDVEIQNLPEGYELEETKYHLTRKNATLTLTIPAKIVDKKPSKSLAYRVGSVLYDESMTIVGANEPDDKETTVGDLLKNYKAILINMYFTTCPGCIYEVDYLVNSYSMKSKTGKPYGEEVAMLMLARDNETKQRIRTFKANPNTYYDQKAKSRNLPLMMAYSADFHNHFANNKTDFGGWPTTIIIDSEGVIIYMKTDVASNPQHFTTQMDRGIEAYNRLHPEEEKTSSSFAAFEAVLPEKVSVGERKEERIG